MNMKHLTFIFLLSLFSLLSTLANVDPYMQFLQKGDSCLADYNYKSAMEFYEKAIALKSNYATPKIRLAECHYKRGNYPACELILEKAAFFNKDSLTHEALREMFYCKAYNSAYEAQILWGSILLERYPYDGDIVAALAGVYNNDEILLPAKAVDLTEMYLTGDPDNIAVLSRNAYAHYLGKNYGTAVMRYNKIVELGDSSVNTNYYLGMSHWRLHEYEEAKDCLIKAVEMNKYESAGMIYHLGQACFEGKYYDEAIKYLQMAKEKFTPSKAVMTIINQDIGDACRQKGMYLEAITAYKDAINLNYELMDHIIFYQISSCYDKLGDKVNSKKYLEKM